MRSVDLQIVGMTCSACSARIERTVGRMDGVQRIDVNLPLGHASISYDPRLTDPARMIDRIRQIGYDAKGDRDDARASNRREIRSYLNRFLLSALLSFPLLWAMLGHMAWTGGLWVPPLFLQGWFQLGVATAMQLYVAYPFYLGAYHAVRARSANMDVLVALSTSISYLYSHYLVFRSGAHAGVHQHLYFDTSAMILTAVLLGKLLEAIAKGQALRGIGSLQRMQAQLIRVVRRRQEDWIPVAELRVGDIAVVRADEWIATDGLIVAGRGEVDESFLTGESRLIAKAVGDRVYSGSRNLSGTIRVKTAAVPQDTRLSRMIRLIEQAQNTKPVIQRKVDQVAAIFVPLMIVCAAATFAGWQWFAPAGAGEAAALHNALAVLLVSCPCALGLAAPISILVATSLSARSGILFKEGSVMEGLPQVDRILLDKTGTLTEGKPTLLAVRAPGGQGVPEAVALRAAAALEAHSKHPLALAIREAAVRKRLLVPAAEAVREEAGKGITGTVEGKEVRLGSGGWHRAMGTRLPDSELRAPAGEGESVLYLAVGGRWAGTFVLTDRLRPASTQSVRQLKRYAEVLMVTGDGQAAADKIAREAAIEHVYAQMLPEDKLGLVRQLQHQGHRVAMIGDGINDAAALAAADVGIAMDSGTEAAMEAGHIVLVRGELTRVADAIDISRRTMRNIRQNLAFSLCYNALAIPFAAAGWLDPRTACLMMALSSVFVVLNALRLHRLRPGRREPHGHHA
ncbi:heavy metal translocating P-type ATPase [Cohnella nanjingensis]|uniref:P-type Cu(+) transporter n=1 Tax=Cohnella nanjingensis TaxID=1387779 RepID=A0A7X0VGC0_9BACL|nr:cation-translocating P-type ATPase [Cohnella nanjingensis]MBB6672701.1 cadmium-translocating P-type ATPase [Cohnella nanjingensis]